MIPRAYITEWSTVAPWPSDEQIDQDLIISRALCEIYRDEFLTERLAFRGGWEMPPYNKKGQQYTDL